MVTKYRTVTLSGKTYRTRFNTLDQIAIEDRHDGQPFYELCRTMTARLAVEIVGEALRTDDAKKFPPEEWTAIVEADLDPVELFAAAKVILAAEAEPGKNGEA